MGDVGIVIEFHVHQLLGDLDAILVAETGCPGSTRRGNRAASRPGHVQVTRSVRSQAGFHTITGRRLLHVHLGGESREALACTLAAVSRASLVTIPDILVAARMDVPARMWNG